jgi:hypothetical protein
VANPRQVSTSTAKKSILSRESESLPQLAIFRENARPGRQPKADGVRLEDEWLPTLDTFRTFVSEGESRSNLMKSLNPRQICVIEDPDFMQAPTLDTFRTLLGPGSGG